MSNPDFIRTVKKMRESQVMYFRTKHSIYFELSKKLEKEVDSAIKEFEVKQQRERLKEFDFRDSLEF